MTRKPRSGAAAVQKKMADAIAITQPPNRFRHQLRPLSLFSTPKIAGLLPYRQYQNSTRRFFLQRKLLLLNPLPHPQQAPQAPLPTAPPLGQQR